jgi:23S rRNA (uracil1939-C5)-methyltransferase
MDTDIFVITLEKLIYGGDALAHLPDGRAVFVPYGLPGERVEIRTTEGRGRSPIGEILRIVTASPDRVQPPCPYFTACGGCHYQHLSYPAQVQAKAAILAEQIRRAAPAVVQPDVKVIPSPLQYAYRNHVQFHLSTEGALGFHRRASKEVIAVDACHLMEPGLAEVFPSLDFGPLPGVERVGLRVGSDGEVQVILEGSPDSLPEVDIEEMPVSVVHLSQAGRIVLAGGEALAIESTGRVYRVSAGAFFQVNNRLAELLSAELVASLPLTGESRVLELYSGLGFFSTSLAARSGRFAAVESSPYACLDFEYNLAEFDVELYEAPVERVLPAPPFDPDIIVADPPRSGLSKDALREILRLRPAWFAMISCDPATLGREAKILHQGGYRLRHLVMADMFPQTHHIESLSIWQQAD